ncbi:MAG: hypothetical protein H8E40_06795 [Chloroflexi bacterium]|nr:hypothetical protein [Chloroflexota bacterium]
MKKEGKVFDFKEFIRELFRVAGIEIKGELHIIRRLLGEGSIRNVNITTLERFVRLFGDGQYVIEGFDVSIKGSDEVQGYAINYVCFEANYSNNSWSVIVRTDEEETYSTDIRELNERNSKLGTLGMELFKLIAAIIDLASHLRRWFS